MTEVSLDKAKKYTADTLSSGYIRNDDGNFSEFVVLPDAFQLAPINTFNKLTVNGKAKLILGGNSFKVNTYHGSYAALKGLLVSDINTFDDVSNFGMDPFHSQIKQIEIIEMKDKSLIIVVANNDVLKVYSYSK